MKLKVLALVGAVGLLAGSAVAAPQFDPNSVYADKSKRSAAQPNETAQPGEKGSVTVLRLNSYAHLGEFTIPDGIQKASIERFNNKVYVLSEKPDKRLAGLWIGRDANGREGLCGYINNSMRIQKCYFILYRDN
ncbi:TPA: hypothetical protein SMO99_002938 [Proteus mirabilis]|uniref:Uncharacterized protein n=2 Tax=Morganellaceae TaxID=1903414 RepID=A0AAI9HUB6_MORMO|nr:MULTISPECIES: hypothetical protein [unclassified Providencia]EKW8762734.1 hypothetical protein [Morganella morganii]THB24668.1 hypothetical protein E6R27_16825 [Providencia sp. MGF014]TNU98893.1 hypothetical protein FH869_18375 [Providencia rettgeri]HEJ9425148.1 hypothetical protein [Proteus mirabilis]WOB88699.1 hypothetical protein P3L40_22530 [Providencia sp. PROV040]